LRGGVWLRELKFDILTIYIGFCGSESLELVEDSRGISAVRQLDSIGLESLMNPFRRRAGVNFVKTVK
jgi:hypothetical protein